jgi:nicotinamidase-related amidase
MKTLISGDASAIVLIEFQNQWTAPGLYHSLIRRQLESRAVIDKARLLVRELRRRGIKIIHAPLIIDPENKIGWLAHLTFGRVFTVGTTKVEITPGLYEAGDLLVTGRYAFDAFVGSNLEELLRSNGINTPFFAGFTTDQCIAKTLRTALRKGFNAHLISDCTATVCSVLQKKTAREFCQRVLEAQELLEQLH